MKHQSIIAIYILVCCASSCTNDPADTNKPGYVSDRLTKIDNQDELTIKSQLDSSSTATYIESEIKAATDEVEKKYGEQWDFCDCIYKTDSINRAISNNTQLSNDDFDKLMARFEAIDSVCKILITAPNTTPDERKAHQRKVENCKNKFGI